MYTVSKKKFSLFSVDYLREICLSVRTSVRVFLCRTRGLWQNGRRSVQIVTPYERSLSLVFWEGE